MQFGEPRVEFPLGYQRLERQNQQRAVSFDNDYYAAFSSLGNDLRQRGLSAGMEMNLRLLDIHELSFYRDNEGHEHRNNLRNTYTDIGDTDGVIVSPFRTPGKPSYFKSNLSFVDILRTNLRCQSKVSKRTGEVV